MGDNRQVPSMEEIERAYRRPGGSGIKAGIAKTRPLRNGVWLGLNAVAAIIFLWWTSSTWIEPELKDVPGASGGAPVVFTLIVFWVLGPMSLLNLGWLAWTARRSLRERDWTTTGVFGLMVAGWIAIVLLSASKLGS